MRPSSFESLQFWFDVIFSSTIQYSDKSESKTDSKELSLTSTGDLS